MVVGAGVVHLLGRADRPATDLLAGVHRVVALERDGLDGQRVRMVRMMDLGGLGVMADEMGFELGGLFGRERPKVKGAMRDDAVTELERRFEARNHGLNLL
jgi:hypothetical protein